jgi:hypothetical protein
MLPDQTGVLPYQTGVLPAQQFTSSSLLVLGGAGPMLSSDSERAPHIPPIVNTAIIHRSVDRKLMSRHAVAHDRCLRMLWLTDSFRRSSAT